jgi:hypothetical protein
VVVLEASDAAGGQIRLASSSPRRRDLIGIIDWRLAECKHFDVDIRYNTYAEADDVLAEDPDLVIVATGGVPNTEFLSEGAQLVSDGWDVLSGSFRPRGDVLLFDDNGQHPGLDAAEVLACAGANIEFVTPERTLAPDVGGVNYPGYFKVFAEHELYFSLLPGSSNLGEVDQQALLDLRQQQVQRNAGGRYQLFRIGDAVASRNIHAAVFDAYRLCLAL